MNCPFTRVPCVPFQAFSQVLGSVAGSVAACLNVLLQYISHFLGAAGMKGKQLKDYLCTWSSDLSDFFFCPLNVHSIHNIHGKQPCVIDELMHLQ